MLVLALQGSPRKGNTYRMVTSFLNKCKELGARTEMLEVAKMNISGCRECDTCSTKGFCPIDDDMQKVFFLLREADVVVMATPVFFYGPTAQLKAVIDRSQTLWSKKHVFKLNDPGSNSRIGILFSVGATKGKNLFDPMTLIAKYFFDAVQANFSSENTLFFRKIERPHDIEKHPTALKDVESMAESIVAPLAKRKKILFLCKKNSCRSQMAYGFARYYFGNRFDFISAGTDPAEKVNPLMVKVMAEKSIDMSYIKPKSLDEVLSQNKIDVVITMGCEDGCVNIPKAKKIDLQLEDPSKGPIEFVRKVRDEIESFVKSFDFDRI